MRLLAAVLVLLALAAPARPQVLRASITLEEMTSAATRIVIGVVTQVGAPVEITNDAGDVGIYTPVTLRVVRTLKGTAASTLTLHIPGGTLDGVTMRAPNERIPAVNE